MEMEKSGLVIVSFTGKELLTGKVFDTTDAETAKKEGLYQDGQVYKAVPVLLGNGDVIPGLEEELLKMKAGEERVVKIEAAKAFGERKPEFVRVVPLKEFHKHKLNPVPGLVVNVDNRYAKVQSVSGGRVRLDFNPELAGRQVEYRIKIEKQLSKPEEKVQALVEKYFPLPEDKKAKAAYKNGELEVSLPGNLQKEVAVLKQVFSKVIQAHVKEVKHIKFVETVETAGNAKAGEKAPVDEK